jgi:hypothetical protein
VSTPERHAVEREALARAGAARGIVFELLDGVLRVDGNDIPLPEDWDQLDFRHAFPSRAHGDQREKLLFKIVQDASPTRARDRKLDAELRRQLPDVVPLADPVSRQVVADAITDEYWTTVRGLPYLVPYHTRLPASFLHTRLGEEKELRYKLFPGIVLLYLCWTPNGADTDLADALLDLMNSNADFTLLDEFMLTAAERVSNGDAPVRAAASELSASDFWGEVSSALEAGAFCQPALDLFQRDLRTVLGMREQLPRRDLIDLLTALLSLHLALIYYRVALVLGERLDRAIAVTGGLDVPELCCACDGLNSCSLRGRILFRVGTRGDRPVSGQEPAAQAYRDLTDRRLLALPATIASANLVHHIFVALGGTSAQPDPAAVAAAAATNPELSRLLDAAASGFAILYLTRVPRGPSLGVDELAAAGARAPGIFALREAITGARRTRLRHLSRDVVNQLVKRETGGSLIRKRGPVSFFELDENFLFLIVKLICRSSDVEFSSFLSDLASYGLAPQDEAEKWLLAEALERLGMLRRFSDAGESIYVHHPIR